MREAVAAAIAPLRDAGPALRWVAPERYHLTLVFLGSVDGDLVPAVAAAVRRGAEGVAPFELALSGEVGTFGRRVLWAGIAASEPLAAMASSVTGALSPVVAVPDRDRPFSAHLTLARAGRQPVRRSALPAIEVPALSWPVERVVLMRSAGGYEVVEGVDLAAPNA